jgi:hypothetical protein
MPWPYMADMAGNDRFCPLLSAFVRFGERNHGGRATRRYTGDMATKARRQKGKQRSKKLKS